MTTSCCRSKSTSKRCCVLFDPARSNSSAELESPHKNATGFLVTTVVCDPKSSKGRTNIIRLLISPLY